MLSHSVSQSPELIQSAANWHVVMHSGEVTPSEKAEFSKWHQQLENAEAYEHFTKIWSRFEPALPTPARDAVCQTLEHHQSRYSYINKTIASCFIMTVLSGFILNNTIFGQVILSDHVALTYQSNNINLSDDSQISLSPLSAVNIHYTNEQRAIELVSGQVMVDVTKDSNRPLIINSKYGSARALGTQFSVSNYDEYSQVSVYESSVEVCSHYDKNISQLQNSPKLIIDRCRQLSAGETSKVTVNGVEAPQTMNKGWHVNVIQQTLIVDDQSLLSVLAKLQEHHLGYLKINVTALVGINVSGVFPLNDVDHALSVISTSLPIKITRYSSLFITIDKQQSK